VVLGVPAPDPEPEVPPDVEPEALPLPLGPPLGLVELELLPELAGGGVVLGLVVLLLELLEPGVVGLLLGGEDFDDDPDDDPV
jgi:hypothetical protein